MRTIDLKEKENYHGGPNQEKEKRKIYRTKIGTYFIDKGTKLYFKIQLVTSLCHTSVLMEEDKNENEDETNGEIFYKNV